MFVSVNCLCVFVLKKKMYVTYIFLLPSLISLSKTLSLFISGVDSVRFLCSGCAVAKPLIVRGHLDVPRRDVA